MYKSPGFKKFVAEAFAKKPSLYQHAEIVDGKLRPTGISLIKYREIADAAKFLEKDFTFVDYGCSHGLFSFLLAQDFEGVSGKMINSSREEIEVCQQGIKLAKLDNLEALHLDAMKYNQKTDFTIYMSLIRHLLNEGKSVGDVADMVVGQTGVVALVEGQVRVDDYLAPKRYPDEDVKMTMFIDAMKMKMKVISQTTMKCSSGVTRMCYLFKK